MKHSDIISAIQHSLTKTDLPYANKYTGKVRDMYFTDTNSILISTDRQSGFDRLLGTVPFKGAVLAQASVWWFENTRHIVKNHYIASPDANVVIAKKCKVLPIEFVVRGYISGSTSTSLWTRYNAGERSYCGHSFDDGLVKNQKLEQNILTPTTKEADHDRPITPTDIVTKGWLTQEQWDFCAQKSLELFAFGQEKSAQQGLILVDTKYEFGIDTETGEILLIDELHTPDSSRFWIADTYKSRMAQGQEPDNIDKEFFRLWFAENCDPYADETLPQAPTELVTELAARYIQQYEMITGMPFNVQSPEMDTHTRIAQNLQAYFSQ